MVNMETTWAHYMPVAVPLHFRPSFRKRPALEPAVRGGAPTPYPAFPFYHTTSHGAINKKPGLDDSSEGVFASSSTRQPSQPRGRLSVRRLGTASRTELLVLFIAIAMLLSHVADQLNNSTGHRISLNRGGRKGRIAPRACIIYKALAGYRERGSKHGHIETL